MTDIENQPPLTLFPKSFTRGVLEGKRCIVVYDAATDETTVIAEKSKWYAQALVAFTFLETASAPITPAIKDRRRKSKLILPGSHASN